MTTAIDSQILFWDTRYKATTNKKNEKTDPLPMNVPETFKHLTNWKPLLKVSLPCSDSGGDFAPTKFSIAERQGDKSASKHFLLLTFGYNSYSASLYFVLGQCFFIRITLIHF